MDKEIKNMTDTGNKLADLIIKLFGDFEDCSIHLKDGRTVFMCMDEEIGLKRTKELLSFCDKNKIRFFSLDKNNNILFDTNDRSSLKELISG